MSTPPPPPGQGPPDDDPFRKPPPADSGGGSPYDQPPPPPGGGGFGPPPGAGPPPPGGPYGGDPYGGGYGGADPLAGMPPLADSGRRVLARIVDMLIVGVVVALLSWAFGWANVDLDADDVEVGTTFGRSILSAVLYLAYDTWFTSSSGQTPGKQLMKLRTANLDDGATPSVQTSLVRAAVLWLPFSFCCYCIWTAICGGWSFFDKPYKQGLHDKAAKTVVVSTG
ncbi:RDD family protein [Streptomyces cavernicola]|uniref:RDD family protein n=1 Tax=Streptomyces cavernicola TaxID=3043613 RepID=A0ABT6SIG7_9ACTN|nr:RDD family protein [Streptomyces sp. B-S-A6]MDI3407991.1 RDD family protein [Streptomyces sp. B-S-A6]